MKLTDEANILRYYPLGDNGVIIIADTASHGIIHAVAKGARKPKSVFQGKIDLFFRISLTWSPARNEGLGTVTEIKLLNPRENIRKEYRKTLMGAYFTKLYEKGIESSTPVPEFHRLLERALNYLNDKEIDIRGMFHFERELAKLHGISTDTQSPPCESLRKFLGKLPPQRDSLLSLWREVE